jgi:hypothetical protein
MEQSVLAWLEAEIASLTANIYRHRGVGPYTANCHRWALHLEAYQKLYDVLLTTDSLDKNASRGKGDA